MGEISEMMLDGILDEYTGEYLGDTVGFPRSKDRSFNRSKGVFTEEKQKYGIYKYFGTQKITKKQRREILISFYPETPGRELLSNINLCVYASENFKDFIKFVEAWKIKNKAI